MEILQLAERINKFELNRILQGKYPKTAVFSIYKEDLRLIRKEIARRVAGLRNQATLQA